MKTKEIKKKSGNKKALTKSNTKRKAIENKKEYQEILSKALKEDINPKLIDDSPFNRRTFFNQKQLEELAVNIAKYGLAHDIAVRPKEGGRYELLFGHRRLRAVRIAGLPTIPAKVAPVDDETAKEIIFSENIHRENPHPMDEAYSIGDMKADHKSFEEIALRLGESKGFVYTRIQLLNLIEPIQEIFLADKITIQEALDIAGISKESQEEFFEQYCEKWNEDGFELPDLRYALNKFKYDLKSATFNIKDKKLLPDAGACTTCPFNTATLKTLFPEYAKEATCTNKQCYHQKCNIHFRSLLVKGFEEIKPAGFIFSGRPSEGLINLIDSLPGAGELAKYGRHEVSIVDLPELPNQEDFMYENDEEDGTPVLDEEEYKEAMDEYNSELKEYNRLMQSGTLLKGMLISEGNVSEVVYSKEQHFEGRHSAGQAGQTAKEVQAAIKAGTATEEMLKAEISRIQAREERAKVLDTEKIQLKVHEKFEEQFGEIPNNTLTESDLIGARLIVYQSLDYSTHCKVDAALFGDKPYYEQRDDLIEKLAGLTDQQFAFLIRMAVAGKSDSKLPNNVAGQCLYQMAASAGLDVAAIEQEQKNKKQEREKRMEEKIKQFEKKIKKLSLIN